MRFNFKQIFIIPMLLIIAQVVNAQPANQLNGVLKSAFEIGSIESVMIEKNGEIIAQQFEGRMNPNRTTNIKSASKSILSLLVGIAIREGYLEGVEQPIGEFFEDYFAEISINKPSNGATIDSQTFKISTKVDGEASIEKVEFFVDGNSIGSRKRSPYSLNYEVPESKNGKEIEIEVKVKDEDDGSDEDKIKVKVDY